MSEHPEAGRPVGSLPVISLVEWHAPGMTPDEAIELARRSTDAFEHIPGVVEVRFFGDFESGAHYYLQVWESREALDAYMTSESMFRVREIALPFLEGRPSRRLLIDYSDREAGARAADG